MLEESFKGYQAYNEFVKKIKYENRFFIEEKFKSIFDEIIIECKDIVPKNKVLYRARIHDFKDTKGKVEPYESKDIGMPPKDKAVNGRVNPKGINYLYLSDDKKTIISEVHPRVDNYITIGSFLTQKDLDVIKITSKMPKCTGKKAHLYSFISGLKADFMRALNDNISDMEYLPLQGFAEYCKNKGYSGIIYPSSCMEHYESEKEYYNYVFFDDENIQWLHSELNKVIQINYDLYKIKK